MIGNRIKGFLTYAFNQIRFTKGNVLLGRINGPGKGQQIELGTGLSFLDGKLVASATGTWDELTGKPTTFPPLLPTLVGTIPVKFAETIIVVTGNNSDSWSIASLSGFSGGSTKPYTENVANAAYMAETVNGNAYHPFWATAVGNQIRLVSKVGGPAGNAVFFETLGNGIQSTGNYLTGGQALESTYLGQPVHVNHTNGIRTEWVSVATGANSDWQPRTSGVLISLDTNLWESWRVSNGSLNSVLLTNQ